MFFIEIFFIDIIFCFIEKRYSMGYNPLDEFDNIKQCTYYLGVSMCFDK